LPLFVWAPLDYHCPFTSSQGSEKHVPVGAVGKKTRSFSIVNDLIWLQGFVFRIILMARRKRARWL